MQNENENLLPFPPPSPPARVYISETSRPILALPLELGTRKRFSRIYDTDSNDKGLNIIGGGGALLVDIVNRRYEKY